MTSSIRPPWRDRLLAGCRRRGWRGFPSLHRLLKPAAARRELLAVTRYGGAEIEVFRGFGSHLSAPGLRAVVFEAGNGFLETRDPAELDGFLRTAGFSCRILERREDTAHALSNFIATRPE